MTVLEEIEKIGLLPVIEIEKEKDALPLAKALMAGGLPCAEVTFRTDAAAAAIKAIATAYPELLVGAGTVLTVEQADAALAAGAKFAVSPGLNPAVVRHCQSIGLPIIPGINNPTGIEQALSLGLRTVKFFPAEQSGGVKMLKAMSAPYRGVKFMPTGGITPENLQDYLSLPSVLACGGSFMVKPELLRAGDFDAIEKLTSDAVNTLLHFEFAHVGVNLADEKEADSVANKVSDLFGFANKKGPASSFVNALELMNTKGRGSMGHIAIRTPNVERAMYHLARRGVAFDESSVKRDEKGIIRLAYFKEEIGGFAYHLVC